MQLLPNIYLADGFAYAQHANFYLIHSEQGNSAPGESLWPKWISCS